MVEPLLAVKVMEQILILLPPEKFEVADLFRTAEVRKGEVVGRVSEVERDEATKVGVARSPKFVQKWLGIVTRRD